MEVDEMVGAGSEGGGRVKLPPDLLDLVFSWSLEDISNEELYKHQITKIPETFQSVSHYMSSYAFPLLEETRAEFCLSMDTISNAPYSEILFIEEANPSQGFYNIRVPCWKNESIDGGTEIYKPMAYDVFILSNIKPETVSDLNRNGSLFNFCSIVKVEKDGESTTAFKVRASKRIEIADGMKQSLFMIFLQNIATNSRIWKSLGVGSLVTGNLSIIKDVLCPDSSVSNACVLCSSENTNTNNMCLDGASELNDLQISAILGSILEMQCNHKCSVKLIWGPPGTGKTRIVSELLWAVLGMKRKVLTCTATHVAIWEVTSRLLKVVKKNKQGSRRTGPLYQLGDILLFGEKNHQKIDDDLCEVFLDYRVDRLAECFDPSSGWHNLVASMIDFLNHAVSHYHVYLENEKTNFHENMGTPTFLEFFQRRYRVLLSSFETCSKNLCTHLTASFISRKEFEDIIMLLNELENFKKLLSEASFVDKELQEIFMQLEGNRLVSLQGWQPRSSSQFLICKARCECLRLLKSVHDTIHIPYFHEKNLIRDFCLDNASLIFCTASSSFELCSVQIQPLDLIIIDDASQLKECESAIPLQLQGLKHAVLIGDENELPAMVKSKVSEAAGLGRSLFQRLSSLGISKQLLEVQYRMHPSISLFPNVEFYTGKILDGPNVKTKSYERHLLPGIMFGPFSFINVTDGEEEVDDVGRSLKNMVEVGVVLQILRRFCEAVPLKEKVSLGIVSPYSAQVSAIKEKLGRHYKQKGEIIVKVQSIDGFQGGEEDVIIISTVRSNDGGSIGFLSNPQRANVALTRARQCLWIVGNGTTLVKSHSVWEALVCSAKERGCLFDADQDKFLAKAILGAKSEHRIDNLLNSGSILLRGAKWKVLFSENFRKSFAKLKSLQIKMDMIQLLLKLADGRRSRSGNVDLTDSHQLTRVYRFKELYLTWSVDIGKHGRHTQVLRVWDLLPIEETERLVKRLDNVFSMYTNSYVDRCKTKQFEGKLEVPVCWNVGQNVMRYKKLCNPGSVDKAFTVEFDAKNFMENSKVNESLLLMKFFSLSTGIVKHLLTANDGSEMDIPFELTDEEEDIIHFPYSSFILGRSGTGKTTVLTMKLIQKEQHHHLSSEGFCSESNDLSEVAARTDVCNEIPDINSRNFIRQIFVTVSPKLCLAVKNHVHRLMSFASRKDIPDAVGFVDMHEIGDNIADFLDIPDSFHRLEQKHYPLVITFQKFLLMLDGTMTNSYFDKFYGTSEVPATVQVVTKSLALQAFIRSKEVNYERFVGSYWPHFNKKLTKKLDPSTVFTQIISHIKGRVEEGVALDVKLGKEDYIMLSEKRISTLSREKREMIYDIFLDYEKRKQISGEFDLSDLVMDLHCRLRFESNMIDKMDFVYIDEVQDLTMRQIALFKHVTRNFQEGFVFAGDTAQTIARGIDFRFEEIRSLFYKEFLSVLECGFQEERREKIPRISDNFQLQQNFRTHAGVLNLAQSIVDVLYYFFPLSIDKLNPEVSFVYGEAPVLINSGNNEDAIITIFGSPGRFCGTMKGFGAEQVVLVRDECMKKQIVDHIGKQALVLTIMECKGLEFQDVLLYNFFGASPLKNQWRVIYGYMKEHCLHESTPGSFPHFDEARHSILCSELKQLYVAITRTRQRLWICETTDEYSQPIFDYWKSLCLVQVRHLDSTLVDSMGTESSPEEWRSCGIKLFNEGNFEMATMCFERAGDDYREKWARAAGLRATADHIISVNFEMGRTALRKAAEIYESIGKAETAASCFITLKEFKTAGSIYMEKCGVSRLEDAGDCFAMAECWSLAAGAYAKAKCFSKCLSMCCRGSLFDVGLNFIEQWRENSYSDEQKLHEVDAVTISFLKSCATHYYELGDIKHMMVFVKAFHSMDQVRHFLKSKNLLDELLMMEVESGNYHEAINISRMKGDILFEVDMLVKVGDFEKASELIIFHVFSRSLWTPGSKGWPIKHFEKKDELLDKAKALAEQVSCSFHESVCLEAKLLSDRTISLFDMVTCLNGCRKLQNVRLEIFVARIILDVHLQLEPSKYFLESELVADKEKHVNEMMNQNNCSVETLMHFWNFWKKKILDLLSYIHLPDRSDKNDLLMYENFCVMYFGVRKLENSIIVLDPKANWLKDNHGGILERSHNLIKLSFIQFLTYAQHFWNSELSSVGTRVLDRLESLHAFHSKNEFPLLSKGKIILSIFEVAKFLSESKLPDIKHYSGKIEKFLALSKRSLFGLVFPLDWRRAMTESMLALRENGSVRQILGEVLDENLSHKYDKLTHGQIGRIVMLLFVTGQLSDELFQRISKVLDHMPAWRDFISALKSFIDCGYGHVLLVCKFQKALESTFETSWRQEPDYISPHCFMYLVECLVFIASSCLGNQSFYTTKSTLFEMLTYSGYKEYMGACLVVPIVQLRNSIASALGYVSDMVQSLLNNKRDVQEWIKKSTDPAWLCSTLVLRLVIVLSLVHLNVGSNMSAVEKLLSRKDIQSDLPVMFHEKLYRGGSSRMCDRLHFLRNFSEALGVIGNPLVVVCCQDGSRFSDLNAVVVTSENIIIRDDVLSLLFPEVPQKFEGKYSVLETNDRKLTEANVSICREKPESNSKGLCTVSVDEVNKIQVTEIEHENDSSSLRQNYDHFWETLLAFHSEKGGYAREAIGNNFAANKLRLEAEEAGNIIECGTARLKQRGITDNDENLVETVLRELKLLSKALDHPSPEDIKSTSMIEESCARLQELRPRLQPLMDLLFPLKEQGKQEDLECAQKFPEENPSIDQSGTDSAVAAAAADSGSLDLAETVNKKSTRTIKSKATNQNMGDRKGEAGRSRHKGKDTKKPARRSSKRK